MAVTAPPPVRRRGTPPRALPLRRAPARPPAPLPVRARERVLRPDDLSPGAARLALLALSAGALALRLAIPRGLWLDEAISVHQAHLSPAGIVQQLAHGDRHPPLYHLALWATVHVLGGSDLAVRAPSIVAGTLVVPALYALGRELYDRRTGVVAALFGALSPLLVWYSQEARMYAFVTLFAVLTLLGCVRVLRRGRARDWSLYALAAAALVASHWFGALLVACTQLAFGFALLRGGGRTSRRRLAAGWLASTAALACVLVPLGVMALDQVHATGAGGGYAGAADGGTGVSFYTVTANGSWLLGGFQPQRVIALASALWPLGMLAALLALGRRTAPATRLVLWCALGTAGGLLVLGFFDPGVFEVRYLIAIAPLAMLLLARLATGGRPGRARRIVVAGTIALLLAGALAEQQLDPSNPRRYDFREALAQVRAGLRPGDVVLYEPRELGYVLERYAPGVQARPLDGTLPGRGEARRVVVLASFTGQPRYRRVVDRQLGALRWARGRALRSAWPGVTVWRFR